MVRRLFYIILSFIALVLLLIALHPWILAWTIPSAAGLAGFEVGSSRTEGYRWIILRNVKGKIQESTLTIETAVVRQPLAWLWDLRADDEEIGSPLIQANGVTLEIVESPEDGEPAPTPGEVYDVASKTLSYLNHWAPWLEAENISITFKEHVVALSQASFRDNVLRVKGSAPRWGVDFQGASKGLQQLSFEAGPVPQAGTITAVATLEPSDNAYALKAEIDSALGAATSVVIVTQDSWMPRKAQLSAPDFIVPPELFANEAVGNVRGQARAAWDGNEWGLDITAEGELLLKVAYSDPSTPSTGDIAAEVLRPRESAPTAQPIKISLRAVGDMEKAALNEVLVTSPYGRLELLNPTVITRNPPFLLTEQTSVRLRLNPETVGLDEIPSPLLGSFQVRLTGSDTPDSLPPLEFNGRTSSVGQFQGRDVELQVAGALEWPLLSLTQFEADLGDNSAFSARAEVDLQQREVESSTGSIVLGPEWIAPYLPGGASADSLSVEWTAQGSFTKIQHSGVLKLESPAWDERSADYIESHWRGSGAERLVVSAVAYDQGREFIAAELALEGAVPAVDEALSLTAGFQVAGTLEQGELTGLIAIRASQDGIDVQTADVILGAEPILHSTGFLPITVIRSSEGLRIERLSSGQQVSFVLDAQIREEVHKLFPLELPVEIGTVSAQASVEGPPDALRGFVNLQVDRVSLPEMTDGVTPLLEQLELRASATRDLLQVEELRLLINREPLIATAQMPTQENWVTLLQEDPVELLKTANARVVMQNYPLGVVEQFLPRTFAETGSISLDLSLREGLELGGEVHLQGLRTRPLEGGATLAVNRATITFDGKQATVSTFDALLGRRQLNLSGSINFEELQKPQGSLRLEGQRLPLVLSENLILRGDLAVEVVLPSDETPLVKGRLNLREGLVLQDLRSLGGGPEGAPVRPPYFSVEASPFNIWRVNINVSGENFLRVETPVFSGKISADATLSRTLGNPLLVGEAVVETGVIRFPFAGLRVENGRAFITRQEPHTLQLDVPAEGGTAGYTINMHVGGSSEEPELEFTSTPPLQQEQILLLVTAGILPEQDDLGRSQAQQLALYLGRGLFRDLTGPGSGEGIGDRLTVESGRSLSEQGRETYNVEYEITDRFSIEGGYDIYDQYNIGIRWNIFEK